MVWYFTGKRTRTTKPSKKLLEADMENELFSGRAGDEPAPSAASARGKKRRKVLTTSVFLDPIACYPRLLNIGVVHLFWKEKAHWYTYANNYITIKMIIKHCTHLASTVHCKPFHTYLLVIFNLL